MHTLSFIVLVVVMTGSDARPQSQYQYQYSPYSRQLSSYTKSVQLSAEKPTMVKKPMLTKEMKPLKKMMPNVQPIQTPTEFKEAYCRGRQPEERIPFPDNANKFIVCHLGEAFDIMSCPRHLVFNVHTSHCENSLRKPKSACENSNPCKNMGTCVDMPFGQWRCECEMGFSGRRCETQATCTEQTCGPNGFCMQLAQGSPVNHFCLCDAGMTYGLSCSNVEANPCVDNEADLHSFPSKANNALFLQCEGHIPHIKFCAYPLVYSHRLQRCDWE